MRIILLGSPGAGKGTQAVLLSKKFNIPHISTGDLLRQAVRNETSLGKEAKSYIDRGVLVPDNLVTLLVENKLEAIDAGKGFILDGFPRNIQQAIAVDAILKKLSTVIDWVIYLKASEETIIQRLSGRRVCKDCGVNFHIKNLPPKNEGICDNCGGRLIQRDDDKLSTIKNRIKTYEQQTKDLVEYYQKKEKLKEVSGDLSAEDALTQLEKFFSCLK
ncbi:MAG: adenylate kinase [Candidatus Omnitrophica bacterium]|nr:adenylate kinase [Candidatus Omnitrophota bacterium]